jgi:hypothetical protein
MNHHAPAVLAASAFALACSSSSALPGDGGSLEGESPADASRTADAIVPTDGARVEAQTSADLRPPLDVRDGGSLEGESPADASRTADAIVPTDGARVEAQTSADLRPPLDVRDGGSPPPDGRGLDGGAEVGLTTAHSFIVQGTLTATPVSAFLGTVSVPTRHDFTLRLDPTASVVTVGVDGSATRVSITSSDGQTFTTTAPLRTVVWPSTNACGNPTVTYAKLTVTVQGSRLQGSAEGMMQILVGDVIYSYRVTLAMTGRSDDEGPSFGDNRQDVDPLGELFLKSSEPLPAQTTGSLTAAAGGLDLQPFVPMEGGGAVAGFHKPAAMALRYGVTYDVMVRPGSDLAGNAARKPPTLKTLAPPDLGAEDGFEGAKAGLLGGALVVEAATLPPIAGARSVFVAPYSLVAAGGSRRFTVRLPVEANDKVVRFSLRPVFQQQQTASPFGNQIRVAAPGGPIMSATLPAPEFPMTSHQMPGGTTVWLGKVTNVEVNLPADARNEVVFDVAVGNFSGCGLFSPLPGYLIDDLRVE